MKSTITVLKKFRKCFEYSYKFYSSAECRKVEYYGSHILMSINLDTKKFFNPNKLVAPIHTEKKKTKYIDPITGKQLKIGLQKMKNSNASRPDGNTCQKQTLVFVHAIFRHGDRTPDKLPIPPNDPYKDCGFKPFGYGALTHKGKRRLFYLGKRLRKRYTSFLGDQFCHDLIEPICTALNRTKMSLQLVLTSLFPPVGDQIWIDGIDWQPIPFHYEARDRDDTFLLLFQSSFKNLVQEYIETKEMQEKLAKHKEIFDYLSKNSGACITNFHDVYRLYFVLKTEEELGLLLPEWTQSVFPEILEDLTKKDYETFTATLKLKRAISGKFLKKIVFDTKNKICNTPNLQNRKMNLFSIHELNIAALLIVLNIFNKQIPYYGACLLLELHQIDGVYGFKIYYDGICDFIDSIEATEKSEFQLLKIPGCDEFCPFEKFEKLVCHLFPDD